MTVGSHRQESQQSEKADFRGEFSRSESPEKQQSQYSRSRKKLLNRCPAEEVATHTEVRAMKCPYCKTDDVYISESAGQNVLSILMVTARCHRCCALLQVPRWKNVPRKPKSFVPGPTEPQRRAA